MSAFALTRELLRFDTVNPPGAERACAEHLGRRLEAAGFRTSYHEFAPGRATLIAAIGGQPDKLPIGLTGHIDTVPLGMKPWSHDPFAGETDGDRLYGRGASDMKSGVAAMVAAALELAPHLARSPGVVLIVTAGEETGFEGAKHLAAQRDLLQPVGALVVGEPTANQPLVGSKGSLKLELVAKGVTAHAAMPENGINAVAIASQAVCRLHAHRFAVAPDPVMGTPTLNVGYLRGGLNINSVPDEAAVGVDIRTIRGQDEGEVIGEVARLAGESIEVRRLRGNPPAWTDPQHAWVQEVYDLVTPVLGERPRPAVTYYGTDGICLAPAMGGPPMIILGPGEIATMHVTDEWCSVRRIEQSVAIYRGILQRWCGV